MTLLFSVLWLETNATGLLSILSRLLHANVHTAASISTKCEAWNNQEIAKLEATIQQKKERKKEKPELKAIAGVNSGLLTSHVNDAGFQLSESLWKQC